MIMMIRKIWCKGVHMINDRINDDKHFVVRWKDEVKRMVFEKEEADDKGPTMERNNQNKEKRTHNKDDPRSSKKEEHDYRESVHDMIVTLAPMEIRAFIMEVTYQ